MLSVKRFTAFCSLALHLVVFSFGLGRSDHMVNAQRHQVLNATDCVNATNSYSESAIPVKTRLRVAIGKMPQHVRPLKQAARQPLCSLRLTLK